MVTVCRMVELNDLLISFLSVCIVSLLCRLLLTWLNVHHLRRFGLDVPAVFAGDIDSDTLKSITDYTIATSRFASWATVSEEAIFLAVLLSGVLPWLVEVILSLASPFCLFRSDFFQRPGAGKQLSYYTLQLIQYLRHRKAIRFQYDDDKAVGFGFPERLADLCRALGCPAWPLFWRLCITRWPPGGSGCGSSSPSSK